MIKFIMPLKLFFKFAKFLLRIKPQKGPVLKWNIASDSAWNKVLWHIHTHIYILIQIMSAGSSPLTDLATILNNVRKERIIHFCSLFIQLLKNLDQKYHNLKPVSPTLYNHLEFPTHTHKLSCTKNQFWMIVLIISK